jgi:hypothetical protein
MPKVNRSKNDGEPEVTMDLEDDEDELEEEDGTEDEDSNDEESETENKDTTEEPSDDLTEGITDSPITVNLDTQSPPSHSPKNVKIRVKKHHNCSIGGISYDLHPGKDYHVPPNVQKILRNAGNILEG